MFEHMFKISAVSLLPPKKFKKIFRGRFFEKKIIEEKIEKSAKVLLSPLIRRNF